MSWPASRSSRVHGWPLSFIIELLAEGWTAEMILKSYPTLTPGDIRACLQYASATLHAEKVYPLEA